MQKLLALFLLALAFCGQAIADQLSVQLPGRADLVLDMPAGWQGQVSRVREDLPPTIAISSADRRSFQILITPIWPMNGASQPTAASIKSLVQGAARAASQQAVEQDLKLQDLGSSGKPGYYFSATDRAPEPNGYKYLTQGALVVDELSVTFTILVNGEASPIATHALEMLRSARRSRAKNAA